MSHIRFRTANSKMLVIMQHGRTRIFYSPFTK